MPSDVELLAIETDVLWTSDERGRLLASRGQSGMPAPYLSIGTSRDARTVAIGADVQDMLADELRRAIESETLPVRPSQEPAALIDCERMLRALGPVERSAGLAWVFQSVPRASSDAAIMQSADASTAPSLSGVPEGFPWEHAEWEDLMNGKLGAWAMCVVQGSPISLCHCARIADAGIEAGTWTHPSHRGRGYASAATAAWASMVLSTGRHVFYSINAGNRSSERVTERLGLHPIGWRWMVVPQNRG